jgi:hypothetical protein
MEASDVTGISEDELRSIVRSAIARHTAETPAPVVVRHASHQLLPVAAGSDRESGACLIEPAVRCTHCGYCQSYGH